MAIERHKNGKPRPQPVLSAGEANVSDRRRDAIQLDGAEQALETQITAARRIAEKRRSVLRKLAG